MSLQLWAAMALQAKSAPVVEDLYLVGTTRDKIYRRAGGYDGASWDSGIVVPNAETIPLGIAFDSDGNLYVVGTTTDKIYRRAGGYSGSSWDSGITIPAAARAATTAAHGIAFDSNNNLYLAVLNITSGATGRIYRRAGGYSGASWDSGISAPRQIGNVVDLAFDSAGDLYIVANDDNKIYRRAGGYDGSSWDAGIAVPSATNTSSGIAFFGGKKPKPTPDPAIHTRTVRTENEGETNTVTEWCILFVDPSTFICIGGGDYTSDYTVGNSYAVDIDGRVTQMGNLAQTQHLTSDNRNYTFLRFASNPFILNQTSYVNVGNTLKTIAG